MSRADRAAAAVVAASRACNRTKLRFCGHKSQVTEPMQREGQGRRQGTLQLPNEACQAAEREQHDMMSQVTQRLPTLLDRTTTFSEMSVQDAAVAHAPVKNLVLQRNERPGQAQWRVTCTYAEGLSWQELASMPAGVRSFDMAAGTIRMGRQHQPDFFHRLLAKQPGNCSFVSRTHAELMTQPTSNLVLVTNMSSNPLFADQEALSEGEWRMLGPGAVLGFGRPQGGEVAFFLKLAISIVTEEQPAAVVQREGAEERPAAGDGGRRAGCQLRRGSKEGLPCGPQVEESEGNSAAHAEWPAWQERPGCAAERKATRSPRVATCGATGDAMSQQRSAEEQVQQPGREAQWTRTPRQQPQLEGAVVSPELMGVIQQLDKRLERLVSHAELVRRPSELPAEGPGGEAAARAAAPPPGQPAFSRLPVPLKADWRSEDSNPQVASEASAERPPPLQKHHVVAAMEAFRTTEAFRLLRALEALGTPSLELDAALLERLHRIGARYEEHQTRSCSSKGWTMSERNKALGMEHSFLLADGIMKMTYSLDFESVADVPTAVARATAAFAEMDLHRHFRSEVAGAEALGPASAPNDCIWHERKHERNLGATEHAIWTISVTDALDEPERSVLVDCYTADPSLEELRGVPLPLVPRGARRPSPSVLTFRITPTGDAEGRAPATGYRITTCSSTRMPENIYSFLAMMDSHSLGDLIRSQVEEVVRRLRHFLPSSLALEERLLQGPRAELYQAIRRHLRGARGARRGGSRRRGAAVASSSSE